MYELSGYGEMIADQVRVSAYAEALRRTVKPGSVVLDIGTGPGFWAVLACKLGARRVYAIEPGDIIQVAREIAAANSCAGRIVFIEDTSTQVTVPERVDVIVSDLRGVLPLYEGHISAIVDARRRFLAPGGTMIPGRDTIWASVVEAPQLYDKIVCRWDQNSLGLDLSPAGRLAVNVSTKADLNKGQQLTKPQKWVTLDYSTVEDSDARGELNWIAERSGLGHGISVWFDTELTDGVGFSNAPGAPKAIYGALFFPWLQPVRLVAGQPIQVSLMAKRVADDYVWRWTTLVESGKGAHVKFDQSSLRGLVQSPENLRKTASDYVPHLSEDGLIDRRILELMDGRANLEEISRKLALEFPQGVKRWQDALGKAGALSVKYTANSSGSDSGKG